MTLTAAPKTAAFAKAFADAFAAEVNKVAGNNGRLEKKEAAQVAEPFRDNAVNYLEHTGQKSVSVEKLIGAAERYAFVQGQKVESASGRVTFAGGAKLIGDLRADYFTLRGRIDALTPTQRKDVMLANYD